MMNGKQLRVHFQQFLLRSAEGRTWGHQAFTYHKETPHEAPLAFALVPGCEPLLDGC
jgi:hypothetical protein